MPDFTDNHSFGRPTEGGDTDDWGRILNEELIDLLEERVVITDTETNRSNYTAYSDAVFLSTDTGKWYRGNGTSWVEKGDNTKADLTQAGGVLVSSQLPQLSITNVDVVADETARLNLDAEEGDFAIQQDNDTSYILSTNDPTVDANWVEIDFDAVAAIAGQAIAPASVDTSAVENQDYNEAVGTQTAASGTVTIDLAAANFHEVEADGDISISFSNVTGTPPGNSLTLYLYDSDGTGPHTVSWPSSVEWSGGNAETVIPSNGDIEISLLTPDGGTTWRARLSGEAFA